MYSKYLDAGGVAVNYLHSGPSTLPAVAPSLDRGELLLFVHGAGANAGCWRRLMAVMGDEHSLLALDFPAHGRSGGIEGLESVEEYSEIVDRFASELELRPFVLIGKGMGASVAMLYAMAHRPRVRGLVLIGAAAHVEISTECLDTWQAVARGRSPQPFSNDDFAEATSFEVRREVWSEQVATDPRVRHRDLVAWSECDLRERLQEVRQPVQVVSGAEDRIVSPHLSQDMCPVLPNARMEVVDGAGHAVEVECADEVASRIREFVGSIDLQERP